MRLWVRLAAGWAAVLVPGVASPPSLAAEPASIPQPSFQTGDSWVFDATAENGRGGFGEHRYEMKVERVGADTMVVGAKTDGSPGGYVDRIWGLDWSKRLLVDGAETVTAKPLAFPLTTTSTWTSDYVDSTPRGVQVSEHVRATYKVVGWVDVVVPAGAFHALKIEENGTTDIRVNLPATIANGAVGAASGTTSFAHAERPRSGVVHHLSYTEIYYVPEIKNFVKVVQETYNSDNVRLINQTDVLVSFKPGS